MSHSQKRQSLKGHAIPDTSENGKHLSREEVLAKARDEQLKAISLRNRAKDKDSTTSLIDLSLARKPPKLHRKQRVEDTVWENDPQFEQLNDPSLTPNSAATRPTTQHPIVHGHQDIVGSFSVKGASDVQGGVMIKVEDDNIDPESCLLPKTRTLESKTIFDAQANQDHSWVKHQDEMRSSKYQRWASKIDLQPVKANLDGDSNAWGSSIPSDASQNSNDSVQPLHFGKLFRNEEIEQEERPLIGWDGKVQPPPDWNDRPRFNNNNPVSVDSFSRWITDVVKTTCFRSESRNDDVQPQTLPIEAVKDLQYHPDGLSFVSRLFTIDEHNASCYGYTDPVEAAKYCQLVSEEDFGDWGKLDLTRHENSAFKDETTNDLVDTWIANTQKRRDLAQTQYDSQQNSRRVTNAYKSGSKPNPNSPVSNVYLRPAVKGDMVQTLEIYNWYIENSPRPAEMYRLDELDMRDRLSNCKSNKLPFLVAVSKHNSKSTQDNTATDYNEFESSPHSILGAESTSAIVRSIEVVVGWAAATDFTASDFVERIAVELEIYVHPEHRQKGIGRCLFDKLLEAVDRGHIKKGGYHFHCAQELRHLYSPGGGRDLHKVMIILRKWKHPRASHDSTIRSSGRRSASCKKLNDREDDYDHWLKKWLESWGFQVEGVLSGIGAKNGRYIDAIYLGRETMWQPTEGQIPDPLAGTY